MMAAKHEDLRKQLSEVEEEYGQRRGTTRGMLPRHRRQKYVGGIKDGRRIYSCTVASTINALDALGLNPHETDDSVIDAIGGVSEFEANGFLNVGKLIPYLRQRGVNTGPNVKLKSLFLMMDIGGVGLFGYGGHAKLISGYQVTDSGEVRVGINDPFKDTLETPRLRDVVEEIISSRDPYPQFLLITKRHEPVPGRVRLHEA